MPRRRQCEDAVEEARPLAEFAETVRGGAPAWAEGQAFGAGGVVQIPAVPEPLRGSGVVPAQDVAKSGSQEGRGAGREQGGEEEEAALLAQWPFADVPLTPVGRFLAAAVPQIVDSTGQPIAVQGYDHLS